MHTLCSVGCMLLKQLVYVRVVTHMTFNCTLVLSGACLFWNPSSFFYMQALPLIPRLPPPLFSSMVGTVWPSQCSGSPHSMMVGLQSTTPSLSVQVLVHSPPVEQASWLQLYPTMWTTLSVLWPPTAMEAAVLPWWSSELVCWSEIIIQITFSPVCAIATNTCQH